MATLLHRGEDESGTILVVGQSRGLATGLWERSLGADGYALSRAGPADLTGMTDYLARRRRADPDLWVIELEGDGDVPEQIAREVLG